MLVASVSKWENSSKIRLSNSRLGYAHGCWNAALISTGIGLPFRCSWHWGGCSATLFFFFPIFLVWESSHEALHPPFSHLDQDCSLTNNHTFLLSSVIKHKNRQKKASSSSISWLQYLAGIMDSVWERRLILSHLSPHIPFWLNVFFLSTFSR